MLRFHVMTLNIDDDEDDTIYIKYIKNIYIHTGITAVYIYIYIYLSRLDPSVCSRPFIGWEKR